MAKKTSSTPAVKRKEVSSVDVVGSDFQTTFKRVYDNYVSQSTPRTKLIDGFLVLLLLLGIVQFTFCVLVGSFVCVFVTTVSIVSCF